MNHINQTLRCSLEAAIVATMAATFVLMAAFAPERKEDSSKDSWRDRDWVIWWQSQQLYGRDPDELTALELEDVRRWSQCLALINKCRSEGSDSISDNECLQIVDTLEDLAPMLARLFLVDGATHEHGFAWLDRSNYSSTYHVCQLRLADFDEKNAPTIAGDHNVVVSEN